MDQKGHIMDQKGLEIYRKRGQTIEFLDQKYLLFSGIRGTPLLDGNNPLSSTLRLP